VDQNKYNRVTNVYIKIINRREYIIVANILDSVKSNESKEGTPKSASILAGHCRNIVFGYHGTKET
jgi:hypothetical protein